MFWSSIGSLRLAAVTALLATTPAFAQSTGQVTGVVKDMSWYEYFYPNAYDTLLLSPEMTRVLTALGILIAVIGVTTACGSLLFERRDI